MLWREWEDVKIIDCWNEGLNSTQIKQRLKLPGRSSNSILARLLRLRDAGDARITRINGKQSFAVRMWSDRECFYLINCVESAFWCWADIAQKFRTDVDEVQRKYSAIHNDYWLWEAVTNG